VDPAELSEVSEICEVLSHPRDADPTINSRAKAGMKMKKCSNQEQATIFVMHVLHTWLNLHCFFCLATTRVKSESFETLIDFLVFQVIELG